MTKIKKILIANRGEIAIRIARTAQDMGITSVAVYSDADNNALFTKACDEAICIGGTHASESYLVQDKIIDAAKRSGADAIHPGYGFLSENASFAKRCKDEGIIFIGPTHKAIEKLGSKKGAKEIAINAGVPVVPGYSGDDQNFERFKYEAGEIGYPVLLKASAGGGGKGMRIVNKASELQEAFEAAKREAEKSFGDGTLLMEKYFPKAKHIEFQIFGDTHGNYTHFFDRECSMQRRYQKVIEESPSPSLTPELRAEMGNSAVELAKAVKYTSAGTVEFLFSPEDQSYYFLEVNARLQVEHPVTETVTWLDLVRLQIEVAQGMPLQFTSENIQQMGHSIEVRICAEDPENNFFPATGELVFYQEPHLQNLRYDTGVTSGSEISVFYDSMIAKVISVSDKREGSIAHLIYALNKMSILGITTNKDFLIELLKNPSFADGSFDTKLIEREYSDYKRVVTDDEKNEMAAVVTVFEYLNRNEHHIFPQSMLGWRNVFYQPQFYVLEFNGEQIKVEYTYLYKRKFKIKIGEKNFELQAGDSNRNFMGCSFDGCRKYFFIANKNDEFFIQHPSAGTFKFKEVPRFPEPGAANAKDGYVAPMPGEIVKVLVKAGDKVQSGKGLLVMSSMKMETTIEAHADGEVEEVYVSDKNFVEAGTVLLKMKE
ncbi:MAG: Acetyl-/propionyl-coenzyme A carboxylase alpha chain [Bacteroidia bacterium]|nr:Acetyl-/propionyl-coenzyme A carboxylase alpha chain [Bacteroidia bacterium]